MKRRIILVALILSLIPMGLWYYNEKVNVGEQTLLKLVEMMNPKNAAVQRIMDEVGIGSVDDVTYSQTDETLSIKFGNIDFDLRKKDLAEPKIRENLSRIGIDFGMNDKGRVLIKYKDQTIKETE